MNKLRKWLIHKLGGCIYLEQPQKIVFKELPCITVNFEAALPPTEWNKVISENEKINLANREAAEKIGRYIIDNGLYEITRNHDIELNREKVRYKIRVIQPPNHGVYVNRFDDPQKFYPLPSPDYSNWRQGKDGF